MIFKYYLLLCLILVIICTSNQNEETSDMNNGKIKSVNDLVIIFNHYHLAFFQAFEYYLIQAHIHLKETFNILPPYDILLFFSFGIFLKFLLSCLISNKSKDTFVYNTPDNAESLYNILNKLNEIAPSLEGQQDKQVGKQDPPNKTLKISSEAKEALQSIEASMENIASQLIKLESVNKTVHEVISESQILINKELDDNNEEEEIEEK